MGKLFCCVLFSFIIIGNIYCETNDDSTVISKIPDIVIQALRKKIGDGKIVSAKVIENNNEKYYHFRCREEKTGYQVIVNSKGEIEEFVIKNIIPISVSKIPKNVKEVARKVVKGIEIFECDMMMGEDVNYIVTAQAKDRQYTMTIDRNGKILTIKSRDSSATTD